MPSEHKIVATCLLAELGTSANVKNYKGLGKGRFWCKPTSAAAPLDKLPIQIRPRHPSLPPASEGVTGKVQLGNIIVNVAILGLNVLNHVLLVNTLSDYPDRFTLD